MCSEITKTKSIRSCKKLLESIIHNPKSYTDFDCNILKDQKRFAALDMPDIGIVPMSLNRWKDYAEIVLSIGWRGLDQLRKEALKSLQNFKQNAKSSRGSKADLEERLKVSKAKELNTYNEIVRFSEQYHNLLEICAIHARHDESFAKQLKEHKRRYITHTQDLSLI